MKYINNKQPCRMAQVLLAISLITLGGCAEWGEWSSNPVRLQDDYGNSVRNMVNMQIYNPDKAQQPEALLPDGMEGNKAGTALDKAYRQDIGKPADINKSQLGTPGISGSGGSTH